MNFCPIRSGLEGQVRYIFNLDVLVANEKPGLARNTVRSFLLGTDQNIGTLTGVRIWHDCRGKSPEWYLHRITVENLSNGEVFWFLCERWLAWFSFS